jgi:prepilin-type N-terminal cleavage/methylation domain-containing protein
MLKMMRQDKLYMKLVRSQAGFTITELMVVIALSGFLMAVAATGFSTFFAKFDELNKISELQRDAFNCMQQIKNGIPMGTGTNLKFSGVATADSVQFVSSTSALPTSKEIKLFPPIADVEHTFDFVDIKFDDNGYVRATYKNGSIQPPAPLYLFPKPSRAKYRTYVTKLRFTQANAGPVCRVIRVDLEAKTEIRREGVHHKWIYGYASYSTLMALNMK